MYDMNTQEFADFYQRTGRDNAIIEVLRHGKWIRNPTYSPTIASKKHEWRITIQKPKYIDMIRITGTQILCEFYDEEDFYYRFLDHITDDGYFMKGFDDEAFSKCKLVKKFWHHLEGIKLPEGLNGIVQVKSGSVLSVNKIDSWNNVLSYSFNGLFDGWSYKAYQ